MAFDAFDKIGQHIDISDGIDSSVNIHDDFYCCGCHCILHIKAVDSNKRAAHFAGKHELWCDDASTSQGNDRISDYGLKNGFLQKLLETVQTEGVKKPSESTSHVSHTTAVSSGNGVGKGKPHDIKVLKTIRQLFNLFKRESFNTILYDNVRICDIYCGPSTKHIYTKYINGLHLVHAQYNWGNEDSKTLFFRFPTIAETQIKIYVHIEDRELFNDAFALLKSHYGKPVLIYAEFSNGNCTITSLAQIVPLSR